MIEMMMLAWLGLPLMMICIGAVYKIKAKL